MKSMKLNEIQSYARDPKNRRIVIGGIVVLLVVGFLLTRRDKNEITFEPAKVEHLPSYVEEVHCVARPRPLAETYLSVQHGGRLEVLNHAAGAPVKAGEIIAVVDRTANAAGLKSALSGYRLAQSDYNRTAGLYSSGSVTREEMDSNRSKMEVKRAELEQAKQRVEDSVIRSPIDGVISVVVFKLGDKVPDGGRIAAVEDPRGTQGSCRLPADIVVKIPKEQDTLWTVIDAKTPTSWTVPSKISVEEAQGGFTGLDREVQIETSLQDVRTAVGQLVDITVKLPERKNVAKVPSLAVVRREGGAFVLQKTDDGEFRWHRLDVVKQNAQETVAEGVPTEGQVLLLSDDLSKIEAYVKPRLAKAP